MNRAWTRLFAHWLWLGVGLGTGCGGFNEPVDGGPPQQYGFGRPTLEVTINGVHFGPDAPLANSGVDLTTTRDPLTNRATDSKLIINAQTAAGAACQLAFDRFGADVPPYHVNAGYTVTGNALDATPDGTVAPLGSQSVSVPQGAWLCGGSGCEGAVLLLTVLAADHVEGTMAGTFASSSGGGNASVAISFYLPTRTYQP